MLSNDAEAAKAAVLDVRRPASIEISEASQPPEIQLQTNVHQTDATDGTDASEEDILHAPDEQQAPDVHIAPENGSSIRTSASGTPVSTSSESFVTLQDPSLDSGEDNGGVRMADLDSGRSDDISLDATNEQGTSHEQDEFVMVASSLTRDVIQSTEVEKVRLNYSQHCHTPVSL